jgi:hypothetical protein
VSKHKDAKALARWEDEARKWATTTARNLTLDVYYDRQTVIQPYRVGVVLDAGDARQAR